MSAGESVGRVDLWHGELDVPHWQTLVGMLQDEERSRAAAFVHERDARRYVVSHAYLRLLLSRRTGIPAPDLRFGVEPNLKPVLLTAGAEPVHFSLSRSAEMTLIGLAPAPLGVDIEETGGAAAIDGLVETVLSPRERQAFMTLAGEDRHAAFFRCWTQKEAYLKATGDGLHFPLHDVEVRFTDPEESGLARIAGDAEMAARWLLQTMEPRAGYTGALAIRGRAWARRLLAIEGSILDGAG
jgi:4'-phosphopantetheinyl transferase